MGKGLKRLTNYCFCEVDYALGGGSSGGSFIEGGVRTPTAETDESAASGVCSGSVFDASAIGAHGDID
jgi:hypothetical protein